MFIRHKLILKMFFISILYSLSYCAESLEPFIKELTEANEREVLEETIQRLSTLTLEDAHILKLIDAAKKDKSDARRLYLFRVIFEAQSELGHKYLKDVMMNKADEGTVVEILAKIAYIRVGDIPFLTSIYKVNKSDMVRRAIVKYATMRPYDMVRDSIQRNSSARGRGAIGQSSRKQSVDLRRIREDEVLKAQNELIRWIANNSDNEEHKLKVIEAANSRPGVNLFGRSIVDKSLKENHSSEFRVNLWKIKLSRGSNRELVKLLESEEADMVKLAGLKYSKNAISESTSSRFGRHIDRHFVKALKGILKTSNSQKIKNEATAFLMVLRNKAVSSQIEESKEMLGQLKVLSGKIESQPDYKKRQFLNHQEMYSLKTKHDVMELESLFGKLSAKERERVNNILKEINDVIEAFKKNEASNEENKPKKKL